MDDRYREGFERLLSDMDEPPSWEQVSTRHGAPTPVPSRGRGLLVAAAAFTVTIVAVGAVVLALAGGSEPVAGPASATVHHIEISWSQRVDLRCGDMDAVDNGGFGQAEIEIWGPNADGLIRIDATAPDGTVERLITTQSFDRSAGRQVWSSYERGRGEAETVFRVAGCVDDTSEGSSHFSMSDAPLDARGHAFAAFISTPTELSDGLSYEAVLGRDATVRDDVWRSIPVTVFTRETADVDELVGASAGVTEVWFDPAAGRWERVRYISHQEGTGTVTTIIEVVERGIVPVDSVSFSTEGLILTLDTPPTDPSDDDVTAVTTTTITVPDGIDAAAFDDAEAITAEINRRTALIDEAMAERDDAERKIRQSQEILEALEAQTDPPASEDVIERQRVIGRVAELEMRQAVETLTRLEAMMADLRARHAELVEIVESHMATARASAEERAIQHAPYLVEEPIGLEPPAALPGNDGASGSGCYPGPGDLPDGIWYGYLLDRDGPTIDFDLNCMYFGEAAWAFAEESSTDADSDMVIVGHDTVIRTLNVAGDATVWMVVGDASEGRHEPFSFAGEWTGAESSYASCPGEACPVWVYINDGLVDAIVQQYLP